MKKYIKGILEQASTFSKETEKPTIAPPATPTKPKRPGPIPTTRPAVQPKPLASADDAAQRFIDELRNYGGKIKFNLELLKKRYNEAEVTAESYMMKGFTSFVNEASLEDNEGIPGEGNDQGPKYLKDVERRAGEDLRRTMQRHGDKINRFMGLVSEVQAMQQGKEKDLEELAEAVIRETYESILDGVKLIIKIPTSRNEIKDMMEESEMEPPTPLEELTDADVISEIQKRKISKNIVQGEAKNTKLILNMETSKNGLIKIFGEEDGRKMIELLNAITEIASFFDWNIPLEVQKEMWKTRSGFSGSVKVEWETKNEDSEDLAKKILNDLEKSDDLTNSQEDIEELFSEGTPTIKALGVDYAMLLHETVKGIYNLIASAGIPEDPQTAELVVMNTDTLADELEDLRYGPYIAADLRDFINSFPEADKVENLREHFFGKLVRMPAADFLKFVRSILMKEEVAKKLAKEIIDEIVSELREFDIENIDQQYQKTPEIKVEDSPKKDLSALTKSELEAQIDSALEQGNMDLFMELSALYKSKFPNESLDYGMVLGFSNFLTLNENVKAAKDFMLKRYLDDLKKRNKAKQPEQVEGQEGEVKQKDPKAPKLPETINDIPDEIKNKIYADPEFIKVLNLVSNTPNYALDFVKFKFLQNASDAELVSLYEAILKVGKGITRLPMTISQYANLLRSKENPIPGHEKAADDLRKIELLQKGDWIRAALPNAARKNYGTPINLREQFKTETIETQEELLRLGAIIADQSDAKLLMASFTKKMSARHSIDDVIQSAKRFIESFGSNEMEIVTRAESLYPGTSVVYNDNGYVVLAMRAEEAQKELCKAASWCLHTGSFWTYVRNRVQYSIFNFNRPQSDKMFIIGATIDFDKIVYTAHDKNDDFLGGYYYDRNNRIEITQFLKKYNYPDDLIQMISSTFEFEVGIKKQTDIYYSMDKSKIPTMIRSILLDTSKIMNKAESLGLSTKDAEAQANQLSAILTQEALFNETIGKWIREEILSDRFNLNLPSPIAVVNLKKIFKGNEDQKLKTTLNKMIEGTKSSTKKLEELLRIIKREPARGKNLIQNFAKTLDMKEDGVLLYMNKVLDQSAVAIQLATEYLNQIK